MVDILLVELDPPLGAIDRPNLAAQTLYLGKTGNSGTDAMAPGIAANRILVEMLPDLHFERVRPRPDE